MYRRVSLLLMAYGGPACLDEIPTFLARVRAPAPIDSTLVEEVRRRYEAIGGSSPFLSNTLALARAVETHLNGPGQPKLSEACGRAVEVQVFVGMLHSDPDIRGALRRAAGWSSMILASVLTPFRPPAVMMRYQRNMEPASETAGRPALRFLGSWEDSPGFLRAVVEKIEMALGELAEKAEDREPQRGGRRQEVLLLFTAHSLPAENIEYARCFFETARKVARLLPGAPAWRVAYQSAPAGAGAGWLRPTVSEVLESEAAAGRKAMVVVPLGFVSEHLETLYDLDIVLRDEARARDVTMVRAQTVGVAPLFVEALGDAAIQTLRREWGCMGRAGRLGS